MTSIATTPPGLERSEYPRQTRFLILNGQHVTKRIEGADNKIELAREVEASHVETAKLHRNAVLPELAFGDGQHCLRRVAPDHAQTARRQL